MVTGRRCDSGGVGHAHEFAAIFIHQFAIAPPLSRPHIIIMASDHHDREPRLEYPRSEPEIIHAGCDPDPPRRPGAAWMRVDEYEGVHRIVIRPPGPGAILFGLLILSVLAALAFIALAGFFLFWIPIVLAGLLLAFGVAAVRHRWRRLRAWLGGDR